VQFNEETGEDTVLGAEKVLSTGVQERGLTQPGSGDRIQPLCDYITYEGSFEGCYALGDELTVPADGKLTVANRKITGGKRCLYTVRLTDLYQAHYWVPALEARQGVAHSQGDQENQRLESFTAGRRRG
jgi:hypothetical protein